MLKRTILIAALLLTPVVSRASGAEVVITPVATEAVSFFPVRVLACCSADELKTIADLNYLARVALRHSGEIATRLYAMNLVIVTTSWRSWSDTDRGLLLGYMAATPDGKYWRPLLDRFAAEFNVSVKDGVVIAVTPTAPTSPPPVSLPATAGSIDSLVRVIVRQELAKSGGTVGNTVQGNLTVLGQLCVGKPCDPALDHAVQIRRDGAAEIYLSSNEGGLSPQFGVRRGISVVSGGGDLGLRLIHNAAWGRDGKMVWGDSLRPVSIFAFDSQGTLSLSQDMPGTVYGSAKAQHMIFLIDYGRKEMGFTSMLPGWKMCVGWSQNTNDFQYRYCPESGNR